MPQSAVAPEAVSSGAGHAAAVRVAGAPTSFQPDCQVPPLAMFRRDVEEGEALELAGAGQRSDVDRVEPDRRDEVEDRAPWRSASSPAT